MVWAPDHLSSLLQGYTCSRAKALLPRSAGKVEVNARTRWLRAEVGQGCRSLPGAGVLSLPKAGRPDSRPSGASSEASGGSASQPSLLERFC